MPAYAKASRSSPAIAGQKPLAEHGDRCWEVDILPATVIEQVLEAHIHTWLDQRLWRQRDREIERARTLI